MLSLALFIRVVGDPKGLSVNDLGIVLIGVFVVVPLAFVLPASWLLRPWADPSRLVATADVALSGRLPPQRLNRRGSGVLLV